MASPWSLSVLCAECSRARRSTTRPGATLEDALIGADFGPDITDAVIEELRESVAKYRTTDPADLKRMLRETSRNACPASTQRSPSASAQLSSWSSGSTVSARRHHRKIREVPHKLPGAPL